MWNAWPQKDITMRRLFTFLFCTFLLVGCEKFIFVSDPVITLGSDQSASVTVPSEGGSYEISFTSALAWTAEVIYPDGADGWVTLSSTSGSGGYSVAKIRVVVWENEDDTQRSARLIIKSDTVSKEIAYTQQGRKSEPDTEPDTELDTEPDTEPEEEMVFDLSAYSADVPSEGGTVQVTVKYNVEYYCTAVADWIREISTKSYDESVHTFEVAANALNEPRSSTITFCGNGKCIPFTITQAAAGRSAE